MDHTYQPPIHLLLSHHHIESKNGSFLHKQATQNRHTTPSVPATRSASPPSGYERPVDEKERYALHCLALIHHLPCQGLLIRYRPPCARHPHSCWKGAVTLRSTNTSVIPRIHTDRPTTNHYNTYIHHHLLPTPPAHARTCCNT
jgi:hypothetical protein